jgi:hypothetical protein
MFHDSPAPDPLVWAVGVLTYSGRLCALYGWDMMTIIIQHPSCPRRAFITHKHRMALQLCALRVTFQTPVVLVFGCDPEIAIHLLP